MLEDGDANEQVHDDDGHGDGVLSHDVNHDEEEIAQLRGFYNINCES